jgi:hypothetical protein
MRSSKTTKTMGHLNAAILRNAGGMLMLCGASLAFAAGVPNVFSSGSTVSSSQMNANFSAVEADIANPNVTGNITMVPATATTGAIMKGTVPFLHDYGTGNTFLGANAGNFTMGGTRNTVVGSNALHGNTTGSDNTASGSAALEINTTGSYNTASGSAALYVNTIGNYNTASGYLALCRNTIGSFNTASGSEALEFNTTGNNNTASGYAALYNNTIGIRNTASGYVALYNNTIGNYNTASGNAALYNTTGSNNIGIGFTAGYNLTTGGQNIDIGNSGVAAESNTIRIGTSGTQTSAYIAGIYGATSSGGVAVYVNSAGQLGTATSSLRYKDDIADMGSASDVLMKLRPVSFYYKVDSKLEHRPLQYGLVAEEVNKIAPQLVANNAKGEPETVYYQFLAPMLLNAYQKQEHTIQAQAAQLNEQKARVAALEQQASELVALRQEVARMSALLARLDHSEKFASASR